MERSLSSKEDGRRGGRTDLQLEAAAQRGGTRGNGVRPPSMYTGNGIAGRCTGDIEGKSRGGMELLSKVLPVMVEPAAWMKRSSGLGAVCVPTNIGT